MTTYKTVEEQNKALEAQGLAGYDKKITLAFRIAKKKFFEVTYGDLDSRSQNPYFSTSAGILNYVRSDWNQCGQAQRDVLPKGSIAFKFFEKWDVKHLHVLTLEEYQELENDLEALKERYPYIESQRFYKIVEFDREQSK